MADRVASVVTFVAAAGLLALGILLGSISSGNGAPPALVMGAGLVAEIGVLIVLLYAFTKAGRAAWAEAGKGLTIAAITLLLVGDAVNAEAARNLGNGLLYLVFVLLGILMWPAHPKLAAFAALNGVIGFAFLGFAQRLGLPPELNFMLIVVWLVALGIDWLRDPWPAGFAAIGETSAA